MLIALSDKYSRKILGATISKAKSVQEIIREKEIPSTSAYRRIKFLKENKLLRAERIVLDEDGVKFEMLRSTISKIEVKFQEESIDITVIKNRQAIDKMANIFFSMRDQE